MRRCNVARPLILALMAAVCIATTTASLRAKEFEFDGAASYDGANVVDDSPTATSTTQATAEPTSSTDKRANDNDDDAGSSRANPLPPLKGKNVKAKKDTKKAATGKKKASKRQESDSKTSTTGKPSPAGATTPAGGGSGGSTTPSNKDDASTPKSGGMPTPLPTSTTSSGMHPTSQPSSFDEPKLATPSMFQQLPQTFGPEMPGTQEPEVALSPAPHFDNSDVSVKFMRRVLAHLGNCGSDLFAKSQGPKWKLPESCCHGISKLASHYVTLLTLKTFCSIRNSASNSNTKILYKPTLQYTPLVVELGEMVPADNQAAEVFRKLVSCVVFLSTFQKAQYIENKCCQILEVGELCIVSENVANSRSSALFDAEKEPQIRFK